jgi:hypothetical protein
MPLKADHISTQHRRHVIAIATTAHDHQNTLQTTEVPFNERGMERGKASALILK